MTGVGSQRHSKKYIYVYMHIYIDAKAAHIEKPLNTLQMADNKRPKHVAELTNK
jgi:hypothetical protein